MGKLMVKKAYMEHPGKKPATMCKKQFFGV
jgi:hypothetical protein